MDVKRYHGHRAHLVRMWDELLRAPSMPQVDRWVAAHMKSHRSFGKNDRRWYSEALFAAVRHCCFALFCGRFEEKGGSEAPERFLDAFAREAADSAALLALLRGASRERFFEWVGVRYRQEEGHAPDVYPERALHAARRAGAARLAGAIRACPDLAMRLVYHSIPPWYEAPLRERAALSKWREPDVREFLRRQGSRPPLWLRPNHPARRQELVEELRRAGFAVVHAGEALGVTGATSIFELASSKSGLFEIQDLASQKIGETAAPARGELAWDCCAGGGGKTIQLAAALGNSGAVYASDIRAYKLDEIRRRARRAGFFNVRCLPWDGGALPDFPLEVTKRGGFDRVLVDAPCSSSGTWRRNPDARYRTDPAAVAELAALQLRLLESAAKAVAPGGRLVYATCSWLPEENERVAQRFADRSPAFAPARQSLFGSPQADADTTFAATFVRK